MSLSAVSLETPFTASQTGLAATVSGGSGSSATATVDTDGAGAITNYTVVTPGTDYVQGENVTVTEDGGAGSATAQVTATS